MLNRLVATLAFALFASSAMASEVWVPVWTASAAPANFDGAPGAPLSFADQTVRQDMRLGASAKRLRLRLAKLARSFLMLICS